MSDDIIDLPEVLDRVQDDKDLLLELFDIFQTDYKEKRKLLEQALMENNFEEVRSIAHSLKGASGNISAKQLRPVFVVLEDMGKSQNISDFQTYLQKLDQYYAFLEKRIEELKKQFGH